MECFNEFIVPQYSQEGVEEFSKYVNPDSIANRLKTTDNFVILALEKQKVIGVVEVRSHNHISLLFVNREHHNKGIAKSLLKYALEKCKQFNPNLGVLDVNSSPYAVEIYSKMGVVQTDIEQVKNGIRFIAMILKLDNNCYIFNNKQEGFTVKVSEKVNSIT